MIREVSEILNSFLCQRGKAADETALFRTLNNVWYSLRKEGCFFLKTDAAFEVPELRAFLGFAEQFRDKFQITADYAVLDYWLPKPYINAVYVALDDDLRSQEQARKHAGRLTALYKDKEIESIIFDSNKVMGVLSHYETFALSRRAKRRWSEFQDEYIVDINEIERELKKAVPEEFASVRASEGADYIRALKNLYDKIQKSEPREWIRRCLNEYCRGLEKLPEAATRVHGVEFEDPYSAFLTYLAFFSSINPEEVQEFTYFPVQMVAAPEKTMRWVGGLLLPFVQAPPREMRVAISDVAKVLIPNLYSSYVDGLLLESLEKSAQAQIMSRNMSHNLGSHALARIKGADLKKAPGDSERLLGYLQERMDFVARVATEWPTWREPVLFYGDLVRGFLKQGLLLDNLVADDGYRAEKQIEFYVLLPGREKQSEAIRLEFQPGVGGGQGEEESYSEFREQSLNAAGANSDVLVAIPGGPVGRQAFYGFLENAIRNAAKHNAGRYPLRVILKLEGTGGGPRASAFYRFRYQDSISTINEKQLDSVKKHLKRGLVDEKNRQPVAEAWGIQEMKVYARYAAYPFHSGDVRSVLDGEAGEQFLGAKREPFLGGGAGAASPPAGTRPDGGDAQAHQYLTYTLALQRPALAFVAGDLGVSLDEQLGSLYGLEFLDEGDHNRALAGLPSHRPGLLYLALNLDESNLDGFLELLKERRFTLPARVLIRPGRDLESSRLREKLRDKWLSHHVRVDADDSPLVGELERRLDGNEQVQHCVVDLYRRWLQAVAHERGFVTPFNLVLYFDRDGSPYPERWAGLRESVHRFGLYALPRTDPLRPSEPPPASGQLINVFPIAKQVVSGPPPKPAKDFTLAAPYTVTPYAWYGRNGFADRRPMIRKGTEDETWMVFDNHGAATLVGVKQRRFHQYVGAYSQGGSRKTDNRESAEKGGSQLPNNREAFDRLTNVPQGFVGVLSLMQLVEASLLRVLILDERVAGAVLDLTPPGAGQAKRRLRWRPLGESSDYGAEIARNLRKAGIYFAAFFRFTADENDPGLCVLRAEEEVENPLRQPPIGMIQVQGNCAVSYSEPSTGRAGTRAGDATAADGKSAARDGRTFDAVIVHKGLLEWLESSLGRRGVAFDQKQFLDSLHALGGRVILTSGRGAQMEGPLADYPFVEFAVLESYVVRELSKASLGNVLMSVSSQGVVNESYRQRVGHSGEQAGGARA